MMPQEIKHFCDALRKTEYPQSYNYYIHRGVNKQVSCCANGVLVLSVNNESDSAYNVFKIMSNNLGDWMHGVPEDFTLRFGTPFDIQDLINILNDDYRLTFREIAEFLETTFTPVDLEGLK